MENNFKIHAEAFTYLEEEIFKLNRKAVKYQCSPIQLFITDTERIVNKDHSVDVYYKVLISGDKPKVGKYTFIASLQHTTSGNIVRLLPGETVTEVYRDSKSYCEHCNTNRRRNNTIHHLGKRKPP